MDISLIKTGRHNAVYIPNNEAPLRREIAEANKNGDCIINIRGGYFRPDVNDSTDMELWEHYMARELHRAREIQYKRLKMKIAMLERIKKYGKEDV